MGVSSHIHAPSASLPPVLVCMLEVALRGDGLKPMVPFNPSHAREPSSKDATTSSWHRY